MKKRYLFTLLFMSCLSFSFIGAKADTQSGKSETVILTEEERYNEEYYKQPAAYFAAEKPKLYSMARNTLSLEEYLVSEIEAGKKTIDVSAYQIPKEEAAEEYFRIINHNPQLFYIKSKASYNYNTTQGFVVSYKITYIDGITEENLAVMREELKEATRQAVSQVDKALDEYQQALLVHDYLVQNCEYDRENFDKDTIPDISHTAYGCLVNKVAVCDGYANAFAYIMNMLGIPCELVTSEPMEHAWNMIEIDGEWYHVDVTWDDPTPDLIGRVAHSYFLLSDNKISDNSPEEPNKEENATNHYAWTGDNRADSTLYDDAFWEEIESAICYYNRSWYYSRWQLENNNYKEAIKLMKKEKNELLTDAETVVDSLPVFSSADNESYYPASFVYPSTAHNRLYFNSPTEIYQLNRAGNITTVYQPDALSGNLIYGFTVRGNELWYAPASEPPTAKQTDIRQYTLPEITDITAEDIVGEYNKAPYFIELDGLQEGDIVEYLGADGGYGDDQPEMIETGEYEVEFRVDRDGCGTLYGRAGVTIEQAEPDYELPTGLVGYVGDTLGSVKLPKGFSWENDEETLLEKRGTANYLLTYEPEDTKNYKTVGGIEVELEIDCNHQYISKLKTPPSEEESAIETYYCKLCEDTYTRTVDESLPKLTGISAEDIVEPYTKATHLITVQGIKEGDDIQYSLPDEWYQNEQPKIKEIGTYQVYYKVEREGYQPFYGTAAVTVICSEHEYTSVITKNPTETEEGIRTYTCKVCGKTYTEEIDKKAPADSDIKDTEDDKKTLADSSIKAPVTSDKASLGNDDRINITNFESVKDETLYDSSKSKTVLKKVKISSAKRKGGSRVKLTWTKIANASGYEIYMKKGNGKYKRIKTISRGKTVSYTKKGLNKKSVYTFKVRAYAKINGRKVYGAYSSSRRVR